MAARLSPVAEQINSKGHCMNSERSVDTLSSVAPLLRVKPQLQQLCRFGAQWASEHASETNRWAPFHLVTRGGCILQLSGQVRTIKLAAGDIVVLPHGTPHVVRSSSTPPDARGPFGIRSQPFGPVELKTNTEGKPQTQLICGRLRFDLAHPNLLLAALPDAIVVSAADDGADASRLRMFMSAIQGEIEANLAGAAAIASDLASALFVMVVRIHLRRAGASKGLLGLLAHRQLGEAVKAMLEEPARNWNLNELAARANASRASFVRMFRRVAQRSPLEFLTELRLELASRKLRTTRLALADVAAEAGYQSESSFSRAFRRRFGRPPGALRPRRI
jgi:AraC family transcriptional regulator, activator of mtrCDE